MSAQSCEIWINQSATLFPEPSNTFPLKSLNSLIIANNLPHPLRLTIRVEIFCILHEFKQRFANISFIVCPQDKTLSPDCHREVATEQEAERNENIEAINIQDECLIFPLAIV